MTHEDAFLQALTEPPMRRDDDWSTPIGLNARAPLAHTSTEIYQFAGASGRLAAWHSVGGLTGTAAEAEFEWLAVQANGCTWA